MGFNPRCLIVMKTLIRTDWVLLSTATIILRDLASILLLAMSCQLWEQSDSTTLSTFSPASSASAGNVPAVASNCSTYFRIFSISRLLIIPAYAARRPMVCCQQMRRYEASSQTITRLFRLIANKIGNLAFGGSSFHIGQIRPIPNGDLECKSVYSHSACSSLNSV